ncbi:shikimate kinase [Anoxybacteroides amylolyticum]|uniref:Shikimate kinase n=1 Tax=Anoxybacteroides amylolyticum TaxID=294699 RepID=A0A160F5W2_9BACL|nr:shikimate kinase [Anoxybacillus amylolyticus]ANB61163.1 dephospho-CoA kinase family protein [Anoxybacillus amylolyticus]
MKRVYLTGFMGAGKTTVGRALAEQLCVPMIDTDSYIEEKIGKPIKQIFVEEGEAAFRRYEREFLRTLPPDKRIVTTGGGMVIQPENREWMKQTGMVIYLHCDFAEIMRRIADDDTRPLLSNQLEDLQRLWEQRLPYYSEAHIVIDTTGKRVEEVVQEIMEWIKKTENRQE